MPARPFLPILMLPLTTLPFALPMKVLPMLAPNLAQSKTVLTQTFSAAALVTVYAGAMRFVIGPMLVGVRFPAWFAPVRDTVHAAVENATNWMDDLCVDVTDAIPAGIIGFSDTFADVANQMVNLQTDIIMNGGVATPGQQKQAIGLLSDLRGKLGTITAPLQAAQKRILTLLAQINGDYKALGQAGMIVEHNIPDAMVISKDVSIRLGDDFLNVTPNGPCMVSVSMHETVLADITRMVGDHAELLPYLLAQRLLARAQDDNSIASNAFSQLLNIWGYLGALVDDAIEDLAKGSGRDVPDVLRHADFAAARKVWAALAQTARDLQTTGQPQPADTRKPAANLKPSAPLKPPVP